VIEKPLSAALSPALRRRVRAVLDWPGAQWQALRLRTGGFRLASGGPVLNYGAALPRGDGAVVHGGRVKLTHLDRAFPENAQSFNLLYLVSSAIPPHAHELVRFARSRGVKFVWNQNGVGFPGWAGAETETFNAPMRNLRRQADFIVYQSEFCRTSAERFLGASTAPHTILWNPVDLATFQPQTLAGDTWRLLAAGTHMEAERVTRAIATLAELQRRGRKAELTVAGEFRWACADEEVRAAIEQAGVGSTVRMRPAYSQAEAVTMLQASHVLLHLKYADPCPTAVIEALACGVPVVGSRSGGLPELVGEEGGALLDVPVSWEARHYPPACDVADAVERIMAHRTTQGAAARARAEKLFDYRDWVARHGEIFQRLLNEEAQR
jgi:glycosyltransferase involved in cell wall biosynthesis